MDLQIEGIRLEVVQATDINYQCCPNQVLACLWEQEELLKGIISSLQQTISRWNEARCVLDTLQIFVKLWKSVGLTPRYFLPVLPPCDSSHGWSSGRYFLLVMPNFLRRASSRCSRPYSLPAPNLGISSAQLLKWTWLFSRSILTAPHLAKSTLMEPLKRITLYFLLWFLGEFVSKVHHWIFKPTWKQWKHWWKSQFHDERLAYQIFPNILTKQPTIYITIKSPLNRFVGDIDGVLSNKSQQQKCINH